MAQLIVILLVLSTVVISVSGDEYPPPPYPTSFTLPYFGLQGYKFFKPNPYATEGAGMNDGFVTKHFKRLRAVTKYFDHLFLGNPSLSIRQDVKVNPADAMKWRPEYIRKFGYRGERLVDFLGSGPSEEQLIWSLGSVY